MIFFVCPCSQDSRGNTIGQWLNVTSQRMIVQLSHYLNPEALQGKYKLSVTREQSAFSHDFQVKKYGTFVAAAASLLKGGPPPPKVIFGVSYLKGLRMG